MRAAPSLPRFGLSLPVCGAFNLLPYLRAAAGLLASLRASLGLSACSPYGAASACVCVLPRSCSLMRDGAASLPALCAAPYLKRYGRPFVPAGLGCGSAASACSLLLLSLLPSCCFGAPSCLSPLRPPLLLSKEIGGGLPSPALPLASCASAAMYCGPLASASLLCPS